MDITIKIPDNAVSRLQAALLAEYQEDDVSQLKKHIKTGLVSFVRRYEINAARAVAAATAQDFKI